MGKGCGRREKSQGKIPIYRYNVCYKSINIIYHINRLQFLIFESSIAWFAFAANVVNRVVEEVGADRELFCVVSRTL